ncbi:MAG TPA: single-stranded-DNA-specific exonuclease RecJ, partial [Opitutae bacterium]|nr:single-stranded-DNA-specific exonuclease RecJ [Opitutae bacterium]
MLWTEEHYCEKNIIELCKCFGISEFLAKLLLSRGIESHLDAEFFLKPKLALLEDPYEIPNLKCATIRICDAIEKKENILIVGDYDVDGISSTVIIIKVLSAFGIEAKYVIPHRQTEGYGLTKEVLQRGMKQNEFSLILALDCGTNSWEEADFLQNKNIDLVVVDHHKAKGEIHQNSTIINPHLQETENQWSNLCTAGLCFKLVHGIIKFLREAKYKTAFEISPKDFLPLAAIGTLADMVPLRGENRILAKYGLKHLRNNPEVGLRSLLKLANLDTRFPFDSEDITFRIAPRINACGRLDRPEIAAELLLTKNSEEASKLAHITNEYNEERKLIETKLTEQALDQAETKFASRKAAVITGQGSEWNPGVVGIVAGKLSNTLNKPCLVLAFEKGKYKGSGRGIKGTNLVSA